MHVLIVTFSSTVHDDEYSAMCDDFVARAYPAVDGLVTKTFITDPAPSTDGVRRLGGIYHFADRASAEAYATGPVIAGLRAHGGVEGLDIAGYDVDVDHSVGTGLGSILAAGR